jgi:hypothetical protein
MITLVLAAPASFGALADLPVVPQSCRAALDSALPDWKFATIPQDVIEWYRAKGRPLPVAASGDYDADGTKDWAVLVEQERTTKIAVCLTTAARTQLSVIADPYCRDGVETSPARSDHYNHETDKTETLARDGISVWCWEKAGATYVYERGVFRRIVDSD